MILYVYIRNRLTKLRKLLLACILLVCCCIFICISFWNEPINTAVLQPYLCKESTNHRAAERCVSLSLNQPCTNIIKFNNTGHHKEPLKSLYVNGLMDEMPAECIQQLTIPILCVNRVHCSRSRVPSDIAIVTQLTIDRIGVFTNLLACGWQGDVVASIFINPSQLKYMDYQISMSALCSLHQDMTILFVSLMDGQEEGLYPINLMRILAANESKADYLLHLDVDFKIQSNLYHRLREVIQTPHYEMDGSVALEKRAFILPAFESSTVHLPMPQTKSELVNLWTSPKTADPPIIDTFHSRFAYAQIDTNYTKWMNATQPYHIEWFTSEPWVMVHKSAPKPDIRFVGRNYNKVAFIAQLVAQKYVLTVLPSVFIMHYPHEEAALVIQQHLCMKQLFREFLLEINLNPNIHFTARMILNRQLVKSYADCLSNGETAEAVFDPEIDGDDGDKDNDGIGIYLYHDYIMVAIILTLLYTIMKKSKN